MQKEFRQYEFYYNINKEAIFGLMIMCKKDANFDIINQKNIDKYCIKLTFNLDQKYVNLFNIHLPHTKTKQNQFIRLLHNEFINNSRENILVGDWNIANKKELKDMYVWSKKINVSEIKSIEEVISGKDLVSYIRGNSSSRLDRAFVSNISEIENFKLIANPSSDHHCLYFECVNKSKNVRNISKYKSFLSWKPKWWLFTNEEIKNIIKKSLSMLEKNKDKMSAPLYWRLLKTLIKQNMRQSQLLLTKELYDEKSELNKKMDSIINSVHNDSNNIQKMKNKMNVINVKLYKLQRPRNFCSKELDNLSFMKRHFQNYKKLKSSHIFSQVYDDSETPSIISHSQEIAELLRNEYINRVGTRGSNMNDNFVFPINKPDKKFFKSKEESRYCKEVQELHNPITFEDYCVALKDNSHSKLPGPDGLNAHFYNLAPEEVFIAAYKARMEESLVIDKEASCSEIEAMLFPIPKRSPKGINLKWNEIVNLNQIRFISLINTDVKAWTRLLNAKLNSVILKLVHNFCFSVPKRNLQQALLIVKFITDPKNFKLKDKPSVLKLDYSNAFDITSQPHVLGYLKSLIGEGWFLENVSYLIQHRKVIVTFDQHTSKEIIVGVGLLQGCPLSAALYTIYMDILARKIIVLLSGITAKNSNINVKVIHYIDDILIFCKDENDVSLAWRVIKHFNQATGARINMSKTENVKIYEQTSSTDKKKKKMILKKLSSSKLYGMYPFGDVVTASELSYKSILSSIEEQIAQKKFHNSSLSVKVNIINSMFTSKFVYFLPLMKLSKWMADGFRKKCSQFLWGRFVHVPYRIVTLPKRCGGLGLINLQNLSNALKHNFVRKITESDNLMKGCRNALSEYYVKYYINDRKEFAKMSTLFSESHNVKGKISHSVYNQIKADSNGFVKLPNFFRSKVKNLPACSKLNSFVFKVLWNRLPTSSHLKKKRKMCDIEDDCVMCEGNHEETFNHIMFECEYAKDCIKELHIKTGIAGSRFPSSFDVNRWNKNSFKMEFMSLFMMEAIWSVRNKKLFGHKEGDDVFLKAFKGSINKVKRFAKNNLPEEMKNFILESD